MTGLGSAYRVVAGLAAPALRLHLRRRAGAGREDAARLAERRGHGAARPAGQLFWLHAASVGETLSVLPVLEAMAVRAPALHLLVTTGTRTAAALLGQRLPPGLAGRVTHRFVPLDVPRWSARFLDGWRPDAAAFVESELWPNLIAAAAARDIPLALVNARLSARSAARWRRFAPGLARATLGAFREVLAQSAADAARLAALGAPAPSCVGNLKDAAPPLPADPAALAALRAALGRRPLWLAASTHPGEEAIVLAAHAILRERWPDLLLAIVPRHPERGAAVAALAEPGVGPGVGLGVGSRVGLRGEVMRRAAGLLPEATTAVYVADTMGELGLFYRVAKVALVGGSLVPHGGQNPLEPARLGCPIVLGPHMANFADPVARLAAADAAVLVRSAQPAALAAAVAGVLGDPARAAALAAAAAGMALPTVASMAPPEAEEGAEEGAASDLTRLRMVGGARAFGPPGAGIPTLPSPTPALGGGPVAAVTDILLGLLPAVADRGA